MARKQIGAIFSALAVMFALMPRIALADVQESIEYYKKMEYIVGVAYDLDDFTTRQGWLSAYLEVVKTVSSPSQLKNMALRLEQSYGYDIVTSDGNALYTVDDAAGGAFQTSQLDTFNQVRNIGIVCDWMDYAMEQGPEWPYPGDAIGEGNYDDGDYVKFAVRKSYVDSYDLRRVIMLGGNVFAYGPIANGNASPDLLYVRVPKIEMRQIPVEYTHIIVYIRPGGTSIDSFTGDIEVQAYPDGVQYFWDRVSISNQDDTYSMLRANIGKVPSKYLFYNRNQGVLVGDTLTLSGAQLKGSSTTSSTPLAVFGYWSVSVFDGNFTEDGVAGPEEPSAPTIDLPDVPSEPTAPDTSGNASPTVDIKPITDRLDTIIGEIAAFEGQFWAYHRDALQFWGEIYDMLSYWLSKIEANTRNTAGWARNIAYMLDIIQSQLDGIGDTYRPVINVGNTLEQQLTEDLDVLKTKFPFSLPWDLMALLLMLQAPRHSMVFVVPMAYFGQTASITIDLSQYEQVGIVSRAISRWLFGFYLITRTKDLLLKGE